MAATMPAIAVVALVVLAHAFGAALRGLWFGWNPVSGFLLGLQGEITFFTIASVVIYWAGRFTFGAPATYQQVLRLFGFATAPGLLILVATLVSLFVKGSEAPVLTVLVVWRVAAGFVAVRQALKLSTMKSCMILLIGIILGVAAVGSVTQFLIVALHGTGASS